MFFPSSVYAPVKMQRQPDNKADSNRYDRYNTPRYRLKENQSDQSADSDITVEQGKNHVYPE
jgi:hypothetical protein